MILQSQQTENQPLRKSHFFEDGIFNASHLKGLIEKNLVLRILSSKRQN